MSLVNKEEITKAIRSGKGINIEEILDEFKGSFPTIDSAFKMLYLSTWQVQNK